MTGTIGTFGFARLAVSLDTLDAMRLHNKGPT